MFVAYAVVTVVTLLANAGTAVADVAGARSVLANSAEVGVPRAWLPVLAGLKAAGALGLLLGLLGLPVVGEAAASGLVVFFIGAMGAHVRARVFHNIAFPAGYLALAVASLALAAAY
ncbi:DoxX family protein [Streptomyces ovatisporus]|uniref:DoxX family protein n=1 Tax=Streptomyces ovatisporus TaxID=1128682 RepID=A0ABV9ABP6_9ACTN